MNLGTYTHAIAFSSLKEAEKSVLPEAFWVLTLKLLDCK